MAVNPLTTSLPGVDASIVRDIRRAAQATSVDFGYLMAQASQESAFQPDAKAASSTATGLYQFTEGTWLREFQEHGAKYGQAALARQITLDEVGRPQVANPAARSQILALRTDPGLSAALAGELARENKATLEQNLGRQVGSTDLYLAHFLGAAGATKLLETASSNPGAKAAELLPAAAAANPSVFYDQSGQPRTVGDIYRHFAARIEGQSQDLASLAGSAATDPSGGSSAVAGATAALSALTLTAAASQRSVLAQSALDALTLSALEMVGTPDEQNRAAGSTATKPAPAPRQPTVRTG